MMINSETAATLDVDARHEGVGGGVKRIMAPVNLIACLIPIPFTTN